MIAIEKGSGCLTIQQSFLITDHYVLSIFMIGYYVNHRFKNVSAICVVPTYFTV